MYETPFPKGARDRRLHWRKRVTVPVEIVCDDGHLSATTEDLGDGGIRIVCEREFGCGDKARVTIPCFMVSRAFAGTVLECTSLPERPAFRLRIKWIEIDPELVRGLCRHFSAD